LLKAMVSISPPKSKIASFIVGGAPITQAFADQIGADGYSEDAASAAELSLRVLNDLKAGN
jgi:5-methyltetrahydrofolate--homocysteine methyltransferase